jgi:hypothetical protein
MLERLHSRQEKPEPRTRATAMAQLGHQLFLEGDIVQSKAVYRNALRWAKASGDPLSEAMVFGSAAEALNLKAKNESQRGRASEIVGMAIIKALTAPESITKKVTLDALRKNRLQIRERQRQEDRATEASTITKETMVDWPTRVYAHDETHLRLIETEPATLADERIDTPEPDGEGLFGWAEQHTWVVPLEEVLPTDDAQTDKLNIDSFDIPREAGSLLD